eukprot:27708-Chlamydomonas_euryale.AAC.7
MNGSGRNDATLTSAPVASEGLGAAWICEEEAAAGSCRLGSAEHLPTPPPSDRLIDSRGQ